MYLTQALKRTMQIAGGVLATSCAGRERNWRECRDRVARMAGALRALGLEDGGRAAILALNSDRYFEFFYAVPWAGGVFVPINIRLAAPEIAFWLNDSGAEILFIDDRFLPMLDALKGKIESVRELIYIGDGPIPDGMHGYERLRVRRPGRAVLYRRHHGPLERGDAQSPQPGLQQLQRDRGFRL